MNFFSNKFYFYLARIIRERKFLNLNSTNLQNFHGYTSRVYETSFNNNFEPFGEEVFFISKPPYILYFCPTIRY